MFAHSRSPGLVWARVLVAAGWFTVALCGLLYLAQHLNLGWHSDTGIQAWVSANRYPKQQELILFAAAVAGVPSIMVAGWLLWATLAGALARLLRTSPNLLLWQVAALHLALFAAWPRLLRLDSAAWQAAVTGLLYGALPMLIILAGWDWWRRRLRYRLGPASPSTPGADGAVNSPPSTRDGEAVEGRACHDRHIRLGPASAQRATAGTAASPSTDPESATPPRRWRRWLRAAGRWAGRAVVFVAVPAAIYGLRYQNGIDGGADLFHESEFMVPMDEVMRGAVPYRDVYLQHGLFHNAWLPWLGGKLFGPDLAGVRRMRNLVAPALEVAAYFLVLATFRFGFVAALAASAVFLAAGIGPSGRATLPLLAVATLAAALRGPRGFAILGPDDATAADPLPGWKSLGSICLRHGWLLASAGFLAMLGFWHSVEAGLYALAAGGLFALTAGIGQGRDLPWWRRPLPVACFGIGAFIGFWAIGWYFLGHGALDDLARNVWAQCAYQLATWGLPFPGGFTASLQPLLAQPRPLGAWLQWLGQHHLQWYSGAVALALAAAVLAWRATGAGFWRSRWAPQLLLLTLTGSFFFRTVLGRSDSSHIHYGVFFANLLALFLVAALAGQAWDCFTTGRARWWGRLLRGLPVLLVALAVGWGVGRHVQQRWQPVRNLSQCWQRLRHPPLATRAQSEPLARAGIMDLGGQPRHLRPVIDYLQAHSRPDERVFDFSNQALWLYFADRRPATRYFNVAYAPHPAMQRELIAELERTAPSLVIYSCGTYFDGIDGVPQAVRHPLVAAYLREHFAPAGRVGRVQFWQRRPTPDPFP